MSREHGIKILLVGTAVLGLSFGSAFAQEAKPTAPRPVLVELFTSEGCSSCPPADALLRKLEGTETETGQRIITLSEHVTYWNRLGWSDPFSAQAFSDRQNDYAGRFQLDEVYTPQAVVNGDIQVEGNDPEAVQSALRQQRAESQVRLKILSVVSADNALIVTYSITGEIPAKGVDMMVVLADDMDTSSVREGENAGRTLTHVSVARSFNKMVTLFAPEQRTVKVPLPESSGVQYAGGRHLVIFAQVAGLGRVLDAAQRPVPQSFPTTQTAIAAVH